jgi:hypothetical protein
MNPDFSFSNTIVNACAHDLSENGATVTSNKSEHQFHLFADPLYGQYYDSAVL